MSLAAMAPRPDQIATDFPGRVLVVDDDAGSRAALADVLSRFGHEVEVAQDGHEGLAKLMLGADLVVLDADMPGMDGFQLARRIRESERWRDSPILMVTGLAARRDRLRALEAGASDFLEKPWDLVELYMRSESLLRVQRSVEGVKVQRATLEAEVGRRTAALRLALEELATAHRLTHQAHLDTIRALVLAAEYKDGDTATHVDRMRWYSDLIARGLGLAPHLVELIREASPMHDVGKIGIPDAILTKAGPLTPSERAVMKTHTTIGARILEGSEAEVMQMGRTIALHHHERWDGAGYPSGIAGEAIPLPARICAVADVFDALTMDRCYRPGMPVSTVAGLMREERGRHFDPDVLDVFLDRLSEAETILREYRPKNCEIDAGGH